MPEMRLNTALNVTNDLKTRPTTEAGGAEMSSTQFLEMMMGKLTAMGNEDSELKNLLSRVAQKGGSDKADNDALLNHLKKMQDKQATEKVDRADPVARKEVKEKIKARVREIAEQDTTPVQDTKAMKALQKVAKFLAKAQEEGEISLPPEMVQKLQEFLAKGDDLRAFDMASFMSEFVDLFKGMTVNLSAETSGDLQWPAEIKDAFAELGMKSLSSEDKPLDMMTVMRAVKSLVNQSEKAAMDTLNDKANAAIAAQQTAPLIPGVKADAKVTMKNTAPDKAVEAAPALPMTAMGLPAAETAQKQTTTLTQTAKSGVKAEEGKTEAKADGKAIETGRPLTADAAGKAAAVQNGNPLAADVKAAFTASTPVSAADNGALHAIKADAVAAPGSLAAKAATATAEMMRETARPGPVTQQVIAQIQNRGANETKISVQLSPAELGRVEVRLTMDKSGQAHAVVIADKPETLALLQKDALHLERSLQQAGINANAGNMSFNLRDQQQAQQFGQGRKRFGRSELGDVTTKEVAMNVMAEAAIISDTRINYHA